MSPRLHEELQGRGAPGRGAWGARRQGVERGVPRYGARRPLHMLSLSMSLLRLLLFLLLMRSLRG